MHIDQILAGHSPRMPVHLAYNRRTLVDKELDHFVDPKGCPQSNRVLRRLEPVCCCEQCYACLASPLIEKLSVATGNRWRPNSMFVTGDEDLLLAHEWFSLCSCSPCDCQRCLDCGKVSSGGKLSELVVISDDSLPPNKRRMTSNLSAEGALYVTGRRPLSDLQLGALSEEDEEDDALKRPGCCCCCCCSKRGSWSRDTVTRLCDDMCSWVQPPPNRTICHIIDDVTMERLTASSPVLTRCCLTARKHGTSRHLGKVKAKNQLISR